jgi:hypothetical protein
MSGFTLCSLMQSWKTRPYRSWGLRSRDLEALTTSALWHLSDLIG